MFTTMLTPMDNYGTVIFIQIKGHSGEYGNKRHLGT